MDAWTCDSCCRPSQANLATVIVQVYLWGSDLCSTVFKIRVFEIESASIWALTFILSAKWMQLESQKNSQQNTWKIEVRESFGDILSLTLLSCGWPQVFDFTCQHRIVRNSLMIWFPNCLWYGLDICWIVTVKGWHHTGWFKHFWLLCHLAPEIVWRL